MARRSPTSTVRLRRQIETNQQDADESMRRKDPRRRLPCWRRPVRRVEIDVGVCRSGKKDRPHEHRSQQVRISLPDREHGNNPAAKEQETVPYEGRLITRLETEV